MNPIKKLKYRHFFHGHYLPLIFIPNVAFLCPLLLNLIVAVLFHKLLNEKYYFHAVVISAVLLYLLYTYLIRRLSKKDRMKIEQSEFPEWQPLPRNIETAAKTDGSMGSFFAYVIFSVIILLSCIRIINEEPKIFITVLVILITMLVIIFIIAKSKEKFWENIDETAIYAKIPVDRFFKVHYRRSHDYYAVFYLPDGKYVVKVNNDYNSEICIVCYKNKIKVVETYADYYGKDYNDMMRELEEMNQKLEELKKLAETESEENDD